MDEEDAERQLGVDMKEDVVTCEVPFGSVLFLNNIIPHRYASLLRANASHRVPACLARSLCILCKHLYDVSQQVAVRGLLVREKNMVVSGGGGPVQALKPWLD